MREGAAWQGSGGSVCLHASATKTGKGSIPARFQSKQQHLSYHIIPQQTLSPPIAFTEKMIQPHLLLFSLLYPLTYSLLLHNQHVYHLPLPTPIPSQFPPFPPPICTQHPYSTTPPQTWPRPSHPPTQTSSSSTPPLPSPLHHTLTV